MKRSEGKTESLVESPPEGLHEDRMKHLVLRVFHRFLCVLRNKLKGSENIEGKEMKPEFYHNMKSKYGQSMLFADDKNDEYVSGIFVKAHCGKEILFEDEDGNLWKHMKGYDD